jgi:predicted nuclease with TOPRIM domain
VLANPTNAPTAEVTSTALKQAALGLGLELFFSASTPAEIDTAFADITAVGADALFIAPDAFLRAEARS